MKKKKKNENENSQTTPQQLSRKPPKSFYIDLFILNNYNL